LEPQKVLMRKLNIKMTEKDYNPEQKNAKAMKKQQKAVEAKIEAPKKQESTAEKEDKVNKEKIVEKNKAPKEGIPSDKEVEGKEKPVEKKPVKGTDKPKERKSEAMVDIRNAPVSTKYAVAICKHLNGKEIDKAIEELEQVKLKKKAIPMTGEIPHRKGKMMSGRFPVRSAEQFITILKSLKANAIVNEIEEPVLVEAIANQASRPYGRFGRVKRKRTHIKFVAKSKINKKSKASRDVYPNGHKPLKSESESSSKDSRGGKK